MGLKDRLRKDMQKAAKERNPLALSALRMALAEIKNREIEARGELADDAILKPLASRGQKAGGKQRGRAGRPGVTGVRDFFFPALAKGRGRKKTGRAPSRKDPSGKSGK